MYIHQTILDEVRENSVANKVLVIYGPRQIGKTTLLKKLLENEQEYLFVNGEDLDVQSYLSSQSIVKLQSFVGKHQLLVIDEAQVIPNIGANLKLIVDHCEGLRIIATGSSSFDLANQIGEPLTGRKITYQMYPLSQLELGQVESLAQTKAHLEQRLLYGSYPEVVLMKDDRKREDYLRELITSYLYKDILELDGVRKSKKLQQILQLLAFQIGKAVSLHEIGQQCGLHKDTVQRYIDLLEKSFILIEVSGFSRNLRKEITKKSHYYFYDVGVRNAIINQFNPLALRNDIGELWENYIIIERLKKQSYQHIHSNNYYWRTYQQQEIDWIENRGGHLYGYEMKFKQTKKAPPSEWVKGYPDATFAVIHRDNYLDFIA